MQRRLAVTALLSFLLFVHASTVRATQPPPAVEFEMETLDNGLRVIYAPMDAAPVVHVRVLYHVGSRDELPDRQGFAHMFEHMMFRGSQHVAPEEHMKLIMQVGGSSNAFTSYDQTTYINTLPANHLEMALFLEADRMASFKVSDDVFKTERNVVAEEWRLRYANQPYGPMFQDFARTAFLKHSYRWTPIGDMDQLRQSTSAELQEFFNKYYVPNNAALIIAGDIKIDEAKELVRKYFGWIPKGAEVQRDVEAEPEQTDARRLVVAKPNIPIAALTIGFKTTDWRDDDQFALDMLGSILSAGRTSRLDQLLVTGSEPKCVSVRAGNQQLQDPSVFTISARVLPQADPDQVEKIILEAIEEVVENGVTQEELDKVRTQRRIRAIRSREMPMRVASMLGDEAVFGGDPDRVNQEWDKLAKLTPADLQEVAAKYFKPQRMTVLHYLPEGRGERVAAVPPDDQNGQTQSQKPADKAGELAAAPVVPSEKPIQPRVINFPDVYPDKAPINTDIISKTFEKGTEIDVNGVKVIVMSDDRLPIVNWQLIMRSGGDAEPKGKEGLAGMAAQMMRRGVEGMDFMALSEDLESRGISIEASDNGDNTRLSGSCVTDQLDHAIQRTGQVLTAPVFPEDEFAKVKRQAMAGLMQALSSPGVVAGRELNEALWGDSPMGRRSTIQSLGSITLDDVKNWYTWVYRPNDAILVFSGDISTERARELAEKLLADWKKTDQVPQPDYRVQDAPSSRLIILVDNPEGRQSAIRMAVRAYDNQSDDKFPGAVASRVLSDGIHARLDRYVRAEKGYTYGSSGIFRASRHFGSFNASADTDLVNTAPCIQAMLEVFAGMRAQAVTPEEMTDAKTRVAGSMVMQMQTIAQQADRRIDQVLNDYPIDYFDVYPQRINEVTAEQVQQVMDKYVQDERMVIVVVAPAAKVKEQLERLGPVQVVPMPARRPDMNPANGESPRRKAA